MTENKRFEHKWNMLGMQFICYDCKDVLLGTFADKEGVEHIVDLLNELNDENDVLKQQLKTKYIVNKQYEELQKVKEENEQLKFQNSNLMKEVAEYSRKTKELEKK